MTLDEKVGQLFVILKHSPDMEKAMYNLKTYHQGGVRWQGGDSKAVYEQNKAYIFQLNQKKRNVLILYLCL